MHHTPSELATKRDSSSSPPPLPPQSIPPINPFSAKCGQGQNATKIPKFRFVKFWKQIALFASRGREVSFEWSHHRILSTDSKVTTTLTDSNIHSCYLALARPNNNKLILKMEEKSTTQKIKTEEDSAHFI